MTSRDPLGKGLAFPPRLDADGRFSWSEGVANVRDDVQVILTTDLGERLMLPRFGAGLGQFLHEPNVVATHRLIEDRVQKALLRWERRIRVQSVEVTADPDDPRAAIVNLRYALVATGGSEAVSISVAVGG